MATLEVQERTETGKGPAGRARSAGLVPGVIYGHGKSNRNLSVALRSLQVFLQKLKSEAEMFTVRFGEKGAESLVLIKALDHHPVTGLITHIDFYEVNPDEKVHLKVPLRFVGVPYGVREESGVAQVLNRDLDIVSLPANIPAVIDVDVSEVRGGESLHVSDITIPDNIECRNEPTRPLFHVLAKGKKVEETGEEEEAAAEV